MSDSILLGLQLIELIKSLIYIHFIFDDDHNYILFETNIFDRFFCRQLILFVSIHLSADLRKVKYKVMGFIPLFPRVLFPFHGVKIRL